MSQIGEKVQRGGQQNVDFFRWGGGVWIIGGFPNVNVDFKCFRWAKCKFVLKWSFGNFEYKTHRPLYWNETCNSTNLLHITNELQFWVFSAYVFFPKEGFPESIIFLV